MEGVQSSPSCAYLADDVSFDRPVCSADNAPGLPVLYVNMVCGGGFGPCLVVLAPVDLLAI